MFVKEWMTVNPIIVTEQTPLVEAGELMRQHQITRLLVLRDDHLVGIVTKEDLLKVSPSTATTLSVWELNYVLSKLVIKEAMTRNPLSIDAEATIEEAALLMQKNNVSSLPVLAAGRLVGIITESDIFRAFVDLMGLSRVGIRITIDLEDRIGIVAELTELLKQEGVNIISLAIFHRHDTGGELVLRLNQLKPEILTKLEQAGYKVVHAVEFK